MSQLLLYLLINCVHSQTYDSYTSNQWYQQELNCNSYCYIYCDETYSCYGSTINANTTYQLIITCSSYGACESMNIYANNTQTLTINCLDYSACSYMNVHATRAGTLNFNAHDFTTGVELFVEDASDVNIDCNYTNACDRMDIYAKNARSITVTAKHDEAWYLGNLYAENANYISLTCASKNQESACTSPNWYLPPYGENTYINCYGTGCQSEMHIFTESGIIYLGGLYINTCNECDRYSNCAQFSFSCSPSGAKQPNGYFYSYSYDSTDTFYAGSCDDDNACWCSHVEHKYFTWEDNKYDADCILSDSNSNMAPTNSTSNSFKLDKHAVYYMFGVGYALFVLGMSTLFLFLGSKERKEDTIMKQTWVHANNQRKQNKKEANSTVAYSNMCVAIEEKKYDDDEDVLPEGWRKAYTQDDRLYYQNDSTKQTSWTRPVANGTAISDVEMMPIMVDEQLDVEPGAEPDLSDHNIEGPYVGVNNNEGPGYAYDENKGHEENETQKKANIRMILPDNRQYRYQMYANETVWGLYGRLLQSVPELASKRFNLELPNGHVLKENEFNQTLTQTQLVPGGDIRIKYMNNNKPNLVVM
eukprot:479583_1